MPSKNALTFLLEEQLYCPKCLNKPQISYEKRRTYGIRPKPVMHAKLAELKTPNRHLRATDLTIEQAIALRAVVVYSASNRQMMNGHYLLGNKLAPWAPTYEYAKQLTLSLQNAGLLNPVEQSNNHVVPSSRISNHLWVFGSQYTLTEAVTQELIEDVDHQLLKLEWPDHWHSEICSVIFDLAFAEIKEFYEFCIQERNFPHVNGLRVTNLITSLLEDFSVGQCFHIIFRGAQSATDFMVRSNASPSSAVNYMLTTSENYANRARMSNKDLFPFRRNRSCPRSIMSTILYNDVLKISDDGITNPILEVMP